MGRNIFKLHDRGSPDTKYVLQMLQYDDIK